jgi:hypothetical protein
VSARGLAADPRTLLPSGHRAEGCQMTRQRGDPGRDAAWRCCVAIVVIGILLGIIGSAWDMLGLPDWW